MEVMEDPPIIDSSLGAKRKTKGRKATLLKEGHCLTLGRSSAQLRKQDGWSSEINRPQKGKRETLKSLGADLRVL